MKHLMLIFFLSISVILTSIGQNIGEWKNRGSGINTSSRSIQAVSVVDSLIVWAIPYHLNYPLLASEITKTIDGGKNWITTNFIGESTNSLFLYDIFALNKDTAWLGVGSLDINGVGIGGIYKTIDGGISWERKLGSILDEISVAAVHFFDNNEGLAYGAIFSGNNIIMTIWLTNDGGDHWNAIPNSSLPFLPPPIESDEIARFHYGNGHFEVLGDTIWFGTTEKRIWRSIDRGKNWQAFNVGDLSKSAIIFSVGFKDHLNGIAVTDFDGGYETHDGGETWTKLLTLPITSTTFYQIEHIPGSNGIYYTTYEISNREYNQVKHSYSLDNGKTWFPVIFTPSGTYPIECVEFGSNTFGWGGGKITNSSLGGLFEWMGTGLVLDDVDYDFHLVSERLSPYVQVTKFQMIPIKWRHKFINSGKMKLTNTNFSFLVVNGENEEHIDIKVDSLESGASTWVELEYLPKELGNYSFSFSASNSQLGDNFYFSPITNYTVNDSLIAKDDGKAEIGYGFGFGNVSWSGFYGSKFDLLNKDTLTDISTFIMDRSDYGGSIQFAIIGFDEAGLPNQLIYRSGKVNLADYAISPTNPELLFPLDSSIILEPGSYLVSVKSISGTVGFDSNNVSDEGFWLAGILPQDGPWRHFVREKALMIRPHFKRKSGNITGNQFLNSKITSQFKVYPNPFQEAVTVAFELLNNTIPVSIEVIDQQGRLVKRLPDFQPQVGVNEMSIRVDVPKGVYWLKLIQGEKQAGIPLVKQ